MDEFIQMVASGNWEAIINLLFGGVSVTFGTILTIVSTKFLNYKKSVESVANKVSKDLIPEYKKVAEQIKEEIVDELREDLKVIAESIALSTSKDAEAKIAVVNNVSKIGVEKKVTDKIVKEIKQEVANEEIKKEELVKAVQELEANSVETL